MFTRCCHNAEKHLQCALVPCSQLTTNNDSFHWSFFFRTKLHSNSKTFSLHQYSKGRKNSYPFFKASGKRLPCTLCKRVRTCRLSSRQDMRELLGYLPHSIRVYSLQLHKVTLSNRFYKISWLTHGRYIRVRDLHLHSAECFEWKQGLRMRHRCSLSSTPAVCDDDGPAHQIAH